MNTTTPPEDKVKEFETILGEIKGGWAEIKSLPSSLKTLKDDTTQLQEQFKDVRRHMAGRVGPSSQARTPGLVSDECARHFAAQSWRTARRATGLAAFAWCRRSGMR